MRAIYFIALLITIFYSSNGFTQTFETEEYEVVYQNDSAVVSIARGTYTETNRNLSHSRYFLKFTNRLNKSVSISFVKDLYYDGNQYQPSEESQYSIEIPAKKTITFSDKNNTKQFYIFIKDHNEIIKQELTNYSLDNIKIKTL